MKYSQDEIIVLSIALGIIVLIAIFIAILLRKKSDTIKSIPLLVITIILVGMEIVKQVKAFVGGYDLWTIPLHFCSTYFIWFSLANFTKGQFKNAMRVVAFIASFYLVALFYFDPVSIIGKSCSDIFGSFNNFHTFFFHHLVILYFFINLFMWNIKFQFKHVLYWLVSMSCYYIFAVIMANLLDVNFMNILVSNIPFMENLRMSCGQIIYNIVLGVLMIGVGAGVIAIITLITNKRRNKNV